MKPKIPGETEEKKHLLQIFITKNIKITCHYLNIFFNLTFKVTLAVEKLLFPF